MANLRLWVNTNIVALWGVLKEYVADMFDRGKGGTHAVDFQRLFQGGLTHTLPYLGMGVDDADGKMRLEDGALDIVWDRGSSRKMFAQMQQVLEQLSRAMRGTYKASPLWDWPSRKLLTAHPLGGCAMSDSKDGGVVDEFGQVWNYPNLYVADGSTIPSALAINPSATICALAERTADHLTLE
jgi:cholesterol oxidase